MSPVSGEKLSSEQGAGDVHSLWDRIRALLDGERQRLQEEIRAYPTPIPRCDQQFNHLIERRERLFAELARLEDAAAARATGNSDLELVAAFVDSSHCLDEEARQQFHALLRERSFDPERRASAAESDHAPPRRAD